MDIRNQVCTPEQGRKLKELGVTGPSYFTWMMCAKMYETGDQEFFPCLFQPDRHEDPWCISYPSGDTFDDYGEDNEFHETGETYPAYSVAELIEMRINGETSYVSVGLKGVGSFARGCADYLISMLEKGEITPEECNTRLQQ